MTLIWKIGWLAPGIVFIAAIVLVKPIGVTSPPGDNPGIVPARASIAIALTLPDRILPQSAMPVPAEKVSPDSGGNRG